MRATGRVVLLALAALAFSGRASRAAPAIAIDRLGLPADARVLEAGVLPSRWVRDRGLVLWMLKPEKGSLRREPDDPYACPDQTRGIAYSGPLRVSLVDSRQQNVISTLLVEGPQGGD